jgi:hypothetical protein
VWCISDHREDMLQNISEVSLVETLGSLVMLFHILQKLIQDLYNQSSPIWKTKSQTLTITSTYKLNRMRNNGSISPHDHHIKWGSSPSNTHVQVQQIKN